MNTSRICALLGGLMVASLVAETASAPAADARPSVQGGESLADAVVRINTEVERDCGILSPTPITVSKVREAIEFAANEVADSDIPGRASYVNTLTQILAAGHIPESVHFYVTPITGTYSQQQKNEFRDGRHVAISLNYVLEMPSDRGRRAIGLTQIAEIFQVVKPQEQTVPFAPPKSNAEREQPAR